MCSPYTIMKPLLALLVSTLVMFALPAPVQAGDAGVEHIAVATIKKALPRQTAPTWSPRCTTTSASPESSTTTSRHLIRRIEYRLECTLPATTLPRPKGAATCAVVNTITSAAPGRITTGEVRYQSQATCAVPLRSGRTLRASTTITSVAH